MPFSTTIVISCAGMGTRLGVNTTKALIDIDGVPLIIRQLQQLEDYDDIRIVVGYQADKVIDIVTQYRKDIMFVFNHDYRDTGTGASLSLGMKYAREYVVALDGDLLVNPNDFHKILTYPGSCIGGTNPSTDNPVLMSTTKLKDMTYVESFSRQQGDYEWTGLMKIKASKLKAGVGHVYQLVEELLPLEMLYIRTKER